MGERQKKRGITQFVKDVGLNLGRVRPTPSGISIMCGVAAHKSNLLVQMDVFIFLSIPTC